MNNKQNPIKEKILDLEPSAINIVCLLLVLNAICSAIFYIGELPRITYESQANRHIIWIFLDLYFAYHIFRRKEWARVCLLVKAIFSCIVWTAVNFYQKHIFTAIFQLLFFVPVISLLSIKIKKFQVKILGAIAIVPICYSAYQNINLIIYNQKFNKKEFDSRLTRCYSDRDCVPSSCCHATSVVNKKYASDCTKVFCTMDCSGPLDCERGKPACVNNACTIVPAETINKS